MRKITIRDIAYEAKVSISTVSRVLNSTKEVSPELKKQVFKVIKKHDFRPNQIARSLVTRKTGMIAIIISNISNTVFGAMSKGIDSVCSQRDYILIVCDSNNNTENEIKLLRAMNNRQIDGLLFAGFDVTGDIVKEIRAQKYPTVLITQEMSEAGAEKPMPTVVNDNIQATKDAIHFLYDNGHRKIAFIGGRKKDFSSGQKRFSGYRQALKELGLEYKKNYVIHGDFTFESGYNCMKKILEKNPELPTAVMVCSDLMAIGAMNYLDKVDVKVPDTISIMGFDDIESASQVRPKLSTVRVSYFQEGALAAQTLFSLIEKQEIPMGTTYVPHEIIQRQSVRNITA
ncbi:MAG: LacI family transcriptional regulator [Treponema sp.]|nr:LacI family transcriptional regulator [Treponema sp.]